MHPEQRWTTEDEVKFLNGLGTYSQLYGVSREGLLTGYIAGAERRAYWNGLDGGRILAHARVLLMMEESK